MKTGKKYPKRSCWGCGSRERRAPADWTPRRMRTRSGKLDLSKPLNLGL